MGCNQIKNCSLGIYNRNHYEKTNNNKENNDNNNFNDK
jgi:hypothetical protein